MTTWNLTLSDNPQDVINYASAGDTLIFPSGTYSNMVPRYYGALLYSPKPLVFDMSAGTTLQAATGQTSLLSVPEIAVGKYAAFTGLNDMTASFITPLDPLNYNNVSSVVITIDGVGSPNTFSLSIDSGAPYASGVAITGGVQDVSFQNIGIQFASTTGHTLGDVWYVYPTTTVLHGIRVGRGWQTDWITGTQIIGGTIDLQYPTNNIKPHASAADISGCIFLNGRVNNTTVRGTKFINYDRQVFTQTEHSGVYGNYGATASGVSFDDKFLTVSGVEDQTMTAYHLLGHPSHRGQTRFSSFSGSNIYGVEPNFRNHQFESQRCYWTNSAGVDMWRGPKMHQIEDNISIVSGPSFNPHSPTGWPTAYASRRRNNTLVVGATPTLSSWVDTFPTGWTKRALLSLPPLTSIPGKYYAPIYTPAVINSIVSFGGAELRASYDLQGTKPIPVERITDDNGLLVGIGLGLNNTTGLAQNVYLWWGKTGAVPPPRTDAKHGGWNALFDETIVYLPGDFATNTIISSRDTSTNAKLGKAQTFSISQSEVFENGLEADTRLMTNGFYVGAYIPPGSSGTFMSFGSATMYISGDVLRATFGNVSLSTTITGGNFIGYRWTPTLFQLLKDGVVVDSSIITTQYVTADRIRIGSTIQTNATNGWTGTADEIMICRQAPSVASLAAYSYIANNNNLIGISTPTTP